MKSFKVDDFYFYQNGDSPPEKLNFDANKTRRIHSNDKNSLHYSLNLIKETRPDFIIYSSQHGQIGNSTEIVKKITEGQDVSPALFSISTHNSPVGALTILENLQVPHTAISNQADSFLTGLYLSVLKTNQYDTVLYIYTEYSLPELYQSVSVDAPNLSFGARITKSDSPSAFSAEDILTLKEKKLTIEDQIKEIIKKIKHEDA